MLDITPLLRRRRLVVALVFAAALAAVPGLLRLELTGRGATHSGKRSDLVRASLTQSPAGGTSTPEQFVNEWRS